jgi:hypothetical protein
MSESNLNELLTVSYEYIIKPLGEFNGLEVTFLSEPEIVLIAPMQSMSLHSYIQGALTEILGNKMVNGEELPAPNSKEQFQTHPIITANVADSYAYRNMNKRNKQRLDLRIKLEKVIEDKDVVDGILIMIDEYVDAVVKEVK